MDTRQLIEASATVITITSLRKGDVYKRIAEQSDYSAAATPLRFGVVQDVMNNGTDAAFTALELTPTYAGTETQLKVFKAGIPAALFAATPEEVAHHCETIVVAAERRVNEADKASAKAKEDLATVFTVVGLVNRGELTAPATTAIGQ